ncbi:MAG: hypothetical protein ACI8ZM_003980 [Crocinitomix sp.]|jgi:hypothetical protein
MLSISKISLKVMIFYLLEITGYASVTLEPKFEITYDLMNFEEQIPSL